MRWLQAVRRLRRWVRRAGVVRRLRGGAAAGCAWRRWAEAAVGRMAVGAAWRWRRAAWRWRRVAGGVVVAAGGVVVGGVVAVGVVVGVVGWVAG
ncbi:hypothetical protein ACFYOT_08265 [Saccharothrix saharensis]|uniref:hypothetical protein n=1 Tax=Saccharothrix saharensis TaxID=571190 RepID=UPI00367808A3